MSALADAIRAAYERDSDIISVECPEWPDADGNPSTVRFRTVLTVDDWMELVEIAPVTDPAREITLFVILALDETGTRLVSKEAAADGEGWFFKAAAGLQIHRIIKRADLSRIVNEKNFPELPEVDHEGK